MKQKILKTSFSYSTQKYDDSITRYFPFSKREFPKKSNVVFTSGSFPDYLYL